MKIHLEDFSIRECSPDNIEEILQIQDETFESLPSLDFLRKNTPEMLLECLSQPHHTIGAWHKSKLVAFAVLFIPEKNSSEDLSKCLKGVDFEGIKPANFKLCIVRPTYRGNSLQFHLGSALEHFAANAGVGLLCGTAYPKNIYSINNLVKLGYIYNQTLEKYGLERNLYYKFI